MSRQRSSVHPTLGAPGRLLSRRGLFGIGVSGGLELLGLFQSQQELVLGQTSARRPKRCRWRALMIWRSRSLSARSSNSIALSMPGSSGRAGAGAVTNR
jgi:hypothetical protein